MRVLLVLLLMLAGAIVSGLYGALYDQLTFSISPEFFTKYRFQQTQFQFVQEYSPRVGAAIIGFYNTWKAGLLIGGVLSLVGLINKDNKRMVRNTIAAFIITLVFGFFVGLIGWSVSPLEEQGAPDASLNIFDIDGFKTVLNMNNFSYVGSLIGMFLGVFYQIYFHNRYKLDKLEEELRDTGE